MTTLDANVGPARTDDPDDEAPLNAHGLRVVPVGPDEILAKRGVAEVRFAFPGAAETVALLASRAAGGTTVRALLDSFHPAERDTVADLVTSMRAQRLLRDDVDDDPAGTYWSEVASLAPNARDRLAAASVAVLGTGAVADALATALHDGGVGHVVHTDSPSADDDVWCAAGDDSPDPALTDLARAALAADTVFLPVWIEELVIHIGPMTHPHDTACLRCYLLRVDSTDPHRETHRLLRSGHDGHDGHGAGFLPSMAVVAGQVAATEAVKHVAGLPVTACGHAIEIGLTPFRAAVRRVLRVPRCPACSGTARRSGPIVTTGSPMEQ